MKTKDENFPEQEEVMKGRLQQIMQAIKEDENPDVLNSYKKLIRKTVPLHLRGYVIAYLFKQSITGDTPRSHKKSPMQTIFISIGKNRKVFPRDLVKLFRKSLNLEPHEIRSVKVLDNYSFIDIPQYVAKKAIDTMDGMDFHGRNVTVNFARKKKGETNGKS